MSKASKLRERDPAAQVVIAKLGRLRRGKKPRVLDLFAGCGGFSLGFLRAGCEILAGVELDPHAAATHTINIQQHRRDDPGFKLHSRPRNIEELEPGDFLRSLGYPQPEETVDLLIGGPPCPSFARVGRAKLREIHRDPEAFKNDPRSKLYLPYLNFVRTLRPLALVMENVPEIMNFGGENLAETISDLLQKDGYRTAYTLLNAANYGVPEMRERFFMIGIHQSIALEPSRLFPIPTNRVEFPPGYKGSRDVALKVVRDVLELSGEQRQGLGAETARVNAGVAGRYVPTPSQTTLDPDRHRSVSVEEALADLPPIGSHLDGTLGRGRRDLSMATADAYPAGIIEVASCYVRDQMWSWPGFEADVVGGKVSGHSLGIRRLSHRDYRIFRAMRPGDQYPDAFVLGLGFFRDYVDAIHQSGAALPDETASGTEVCSGIARVLDGLDLLTLDGELADFSSIHSTWLHLRKPLDDHLGQLAAYTNARIELRTDPDNQHPESSTIVDGLMQRWEGIETLLGGGVDPEAHTRWPEAPTRPFLRYRRLTDAYERGHTALELDSDGISPLDPAGRWTTPALTEAARLYRNDWPTAKRCTPALFIEHVRWAVLNFSVDIAGYIALKHQFVPPYHPGKFPNKWRKMEPDQPARTLMAHLGKDSYSHIHYDSAQARSISVREAARLQSFPDAFVFEGSMNRAFRQIGNAVPPLLSFALGKRLVSALQRAASAPPRGLSEA